MSPPPTSLTHLLLSGLALDATNARAEIPTRPARKAGERTAVINSNIVEVRRVSKIAVDRSEFAITRSRETACRVDHASQCRR